MDLFLKTTWEVFWTPGCNFEMGMHECGWSFCWTMFELSLARRSNCIKMKKICKRKIKNKLFYTSILRIFVVALYLRFILSVFRNRETSPSDLEIILTTARRGVRWATIQFPRSFMVKLNNWFLSYSVIDNMIHGWYWFIFIDLK